MPAQASPAGSASGRRTSIRVPTHSRTIRSTSRRSKRPPASSFARARRIAAIVATMGTTDAFGIDDLASLHAVRDPLVEEFKLPYLPHMHADAVIGWAWSVFQRLRLRGQSARLSRPDRAGAGCRRQPHPASASGRFDRHRLPQDGLRAVHLVAVPACATGPSLAIVARRRDSMPYLYHSGEYHPGMFTLETSRAATGVMAALANLLLLGKEGFRTLIGHAVEMAEVLARADHQPAGTDGAERRQLRPGDAVPRLSARHRHVPREGARAERSAITCRS